LNIDRKEFSIFAENLYRIWFENYPNITLAEMMILNRIGLYYDQNISCCHKEISADLDLSKSTISKYLKKFIALGVICSKKAGNDKRRNYYYPSKRALEDRDIGYEALKRIGLPSFFDITNNEA